MTMPVAIDLESLAKVHGGDECSAKAIAIAHTQGWPAGSLAMASCINERRAAKGLRAFDYKPG